MHLFLWKIIPVKSKYTFFLLIFYSFLLDQERTKKIFLTKFLCIVRFSFLSFVLTQKERNKEKVKASEQFMTFLRRWFSARPKPWQIPYYCYLWFLVGHFGVACQSYRNNQLLELDTWIVQMPEKSMIACRFDWLALLMIFLFYLFFLAWPRKN